MHRNSSLVSLSGSYSSLFPAAPIPFFECAYSLTAEHGEEWLLRIADLHMENWKEVYMPSDAIPDEDDENWEVAYSLVNSRPGAIT